MLIWPAETTRITPQRPAENFGEEVFTDLDPIDAVISLDKPTLGEGARFTQIGTLFVHRGADIRAADRITHQGIIFRVFGLPRGDQNHPLTGDDLGWKSYLIKGAS